MYLVGIAGGSGSGKTTFALKTIDVLQRSEVFLIQQDNYYLDHQNEKNFVDGKPNFDSPLAFDWSLFRKHLTILKGGGKIQVPVYDFEKSKRRSGVFTEVGPAKVVIVEGILTLWDELIRSKLDLKIYIKVESDIRFIRRLHRDTSERGRKTDDIISQYYKTVRPMHLKFTQSTQQFADLIIGENHDQAVGVLRNEILAKLHG